jgi:hypothetical protein
LQHLLDYAVLRHFVFAHSKKAHPGRKHWPLKCHLRTSGTLVGARASRNLRSIAKPSSPVISITYRCEKNKVILGSNLEGMVPQRI